MRGDCLGYWHGNTFYCALYFATPKTLVQRVPPRRCGYFFRASRAASLAPPTEFCALPAAFSAAPSACVLVSPVTLPMASLTEPLAFLAEPAIRSLSMTIS